MKLNLTVRDLLRNDECVLVDDVVGAVVIGVERMAAAVLPTRVVVTQSVQDAGPEGRLREIDDPS